jgi:hypothetical protein
VARPGKGRQFFGKVAVQTTAKAGKARQQAAGA